MDLHQKLIDFLDQNSISYRRLTHAEVHTSAEAAAIRGTLPSQGAKAMLFFADKKPILIVLSGDLKISNSLFKKQFNIKDLRLATVTEVESITGTLVGAVPPFGNLFNVPVYVDDQLLNQPQIAFNAGLRTVSVIMKADDFVALVHPIVGSYALCQN